MSATISAVAVAAVMNIRIITQLAILEVINGLGCGGLIRFLAIARLWLIESAIHPAAMAMGLRAIRPGDMTINLCRISQPASTLSRRFSVERILSLP
jgi:hypothetical protein